jgi:hypothetical protein
VAAKTNRKKNGEKEKGIREKKPESLCVVTAFSCLEGKLLGDDDRRDQH